MLWLVGAVAAGMTSFYMFRMMFLTFYGKPDDAEVEHHVHESPGSMTVPLHGVGGGVGGGRVGGDTAGAGAILGELPNGIERFLEPVFEHPVKLGEGHGERGDGMGADGGVGRDSAGGVAAGAELLLEESGVAGTADDRYRGLYTTLLNKYWVDEIYDALFVNRTKDLGKCLARF